MILTLTRQTIETPPVKQQTWPLVVTCVTSDATTAPSEIFVYHVGAGVDGSDLFEVVASVQQLKEIGKNPVTVGDRKIPYFRCATMRYDCRSAAEADYLWEDIQEDAAELVENLIAAKTLIAQEVTSF